MIQPAYRFQLLAPSSVWFPAQKCRRDAEAYGNLLGSLQKLRGRSYVRDGALQSWDLDSEGRHRMSDDERCWHFLLVDPSDDVIGCARFLLHSLDATYDQLRVSQSPLASDSVWGSKLRRLTERALRQARQERIGYAELGGWAITEEHRNTKAALEILIGSYAWAELVGHCICSCTATVRNNSSSILKRMGACSLVHEGETLPFYFDAQYGCNMELLGFDSRRLPSRFAPLLKEIRPKLEASVLIQSGKVQESGSSSDLANLQSILACTPTHQVSTTKASLSRTSELSTYPA